MEFNQLIYTKEYDFLRDNEHLNNKIIFLTLGGSHAYGTNIEGSDIDIRGCALNSKNDLLGMGSFEQVVDEKTDTTVYSFNKLVSLLINCNPNTIEMLGCKKEHYLYMTPIGQELIDQASMFLSRRASMSFHGYAQAQLRRLENNLARHSYEDLEKERHIMGSVQSAINTFCDRYTEFENGSIKLHIEKSNSKDLLEEIMVDVNLTNYPLRDYKNIWSEMNEIVKTYGKLNHRNRKKDDLHLNKHAMHLIRLYLMCIDILEKEQIITYRANDLELLMRIRQGFYQNEDGTFDHAFFDILREYEKRLEYAEKNTNLPKNPDFKRIEEFVMSVNERSLLN
jgi:uncharacterized protein